MSHKTPRQYLSVIKTYFQKSNGAQAPALPYLYPLAQDLEAHHAKKYSKAYQQRFRRKDVPYAIPCVPELLEEALFFHSVAKRPNMVFEVARLIRDTPEYLEKITPSMYLLVLQSIRSERNRRWVKSAVSMYIELHERCPELSPEDRNLAASLLLDIYDNCKDITELLPLKIAYENYMSEAVTDPLLEVRYVGAFVNVYLNSNQYTRAVDLFDRGASDLLVSGLAAQDVLRYLPTESILNAMCAAEDADLLEKWLDTALDADRALIPYKTWSEILSLGLSLNHYGLVKLIYSKVIMLGLGDISLDEAMFSNKASELEEKSSVLASLSEKTLTSILHTLALNGDVNSTLSLIEWHYVHKKLRGEKALTKELCLDIIQAYCYRDEERASDTEDVSIINALGAIDNFASKLERELSYKDVCDALSYRFIRYRAVDPNVSAAKLKEHLAFKKAQEHEEETQSKPRKIRSESFHSSHQGNVLSNSAILDSFVRSTAKKIVENNYKTQTLQMFVNCVLHHIMKYQNATGMVVALLAMHQVNPRMGSEWLNRESFDLMLKTISNSPAGRYLGHCVYQYMQENGMVLTASNFQDLISSALHGDRSDSLVKFYISEAKAQNIVLSKAFLDNLDRTFLSDGPGRSSELIFYSDTEKTSRLAFYQMDQRDLGYLHLVLYGDQSKLIAQG